MYTERDQFILDCFREVESEIGVLTESEIENIIQEKTPAQIEKWLKRTNPEWRF